MSAATTTLPLTGFTNWLACGERGLSSEAIVSHLTGVRMSRWAHVDYPHDPDDFRRCHLLLEQVPLARLTFPSMSTASPTWARLVDAWDEIQASIEAEAPDYLRSRSSSRGSAPLSYLLMRRVITGGTTCTACAGSGKAEACPACKGTGRRSGGRCRSAGCARGFRYCRTCRGNGYTGGDR